MMLKTLTAALTAATLAFGMAACNRDDAGAGSSAGSSADQQNKRSGSAAGGSSSNGSSSGSAGSGAMGSGGSGSR